MDTQGITAEIQKYASNNGLDIQQRISSNDTFLFEISGGGYSIELGMVNSYLTAAVYTLSSDYADVFGDFLGAIEPHTRSCRSISASK